MKVSNTIRSMEKGMERKFHNMNGSPYDLNNIAFANFGGYGQFNNQVDYQALAQQKALVSRMSPIKGTMSIVIVNSSASTQTVTLFNVAFGGTSPTFADSVSVTCRQSNYSAVLNSISQTPFKIAGLKYLCREKTQLSNTFTLGYRDFQGMNNSQVYTAQDMQNNMQNIETEIDDPTFEFDVNVKAYINIDVNGTDTVATTGEQVTLIFTLASIIDPTYELTGQPTMAVNPVGYQSGIPSVPLVVAGNVNTPQANINLLQNQNRRRLF